jgi:uroporphyrinogen-III synthase
MPENKITILSTGVLPAYLAEEAEANNIYTDIVSFIKTEAIQSIEVQQEIEQALLQEATVVFTSRNAIEAVAAELKDEENDPVTIEWNIYCVGDKTAELAGKYFGEEKIYGSADNAEELAELIIEEDITDEVIFFCGDQRRDELPDTLRNNNIEVNEIVVYQTVIVPQKITTSYDGILFYSPSGAEGFFSVNKIDNKTILFAIGNTTSNAIRKYSDNKIIIGKSPDKEQMIKEVVNYFG